MAEYDKRDTRLRENRKESPDRSGKHSDSTTDTNRNDPRSIRCRVFIGNLPTEMKSKELEETFSQYGRVSGVSVHNNFGFVQFEDEKSADASVAKENGKVYYGKRVDVNLAGERRKVKMDERPRERDGRPPFPFNRRERDFDRDGRPFRKSPPRERPRFEDYDRFPSRFEPPFDRRGRSPSPPRRMDDRPGYGRHDDYYMRDRYRDEPPHHREPYSRHPFDHRGEPFDRERREPYDSPRGAYPDRRDEHYDRYDSYNRDYPRPDDYPGPAKRPRVDYSDRPDDMYMYNSGKTIEAPTDCVIVVMNKQQRGYAEMVERRLKSVGLVVELHFHGSQPISELLDDVARRGVLYAVVITSQHEIHRSVTVNILHGTPQGKDQNLLARIKTHTEHRNMPLDDAMRLVGQNFDQYMQDLRERAKSSGTQDLDKTRTAAAPPKTEGNSDITSLLSKAATGADLSADQLTKLIDNLSKRQQEILGSPATTATNGKGGVTASQSSQPAVDPQSIAKQQADLQAKILSILNPGGSASSSSSSSNASTLPSQKAVLPGQSAGAATGAAQAAGKTGSLSTTAKPIFPLYPAQQKLPSSSTNNSTSTARPSLGATASNPVSSATGNQVGKTYKAASLQGNTAASSSYGAASSTTYLSTKPVAPNTYTVGSNQATQSHASYGAKPTAVNASQGYSAATQKIGQPQQASVGQAISTVGAQRPSVAPAQRMVAPTSGPRPTSNVTSGQVRTPLTTKRGLLGAAPVGVPRLATPSTAVRTPSGTSGVRMVSPRGPSPSGRGTVRTASPASIQGQTTPTRGGAVSVRGGGSYIRGGVSVGTPGRGITAPHSAASGRGEISQRGGTASVSVAAARGAASRGTAARGTPATRGSPTTRGTPSPRGAPPLRGAPALRGASSLRGSPGLRGAPAARGASAPRGLQAARGVTGTRGTSATSAHLTGGRGVSATQGAPIRAITPGARGSRGALRGAPLMRGAPAFRGGRGSYGGRGGY